MRKPYRLYRPFRKGALLCAGLTPVSDPAQATDRRFPLRFVFFFVLQELGSGLRNFEIGRAVVLLLRVALSANSEIWWHRPPNGFAAAIRSMNLGSA